MKIESISVNEVKYPLKKPYVLSFGTIESLTSIQITITANGDTRMAETVPLLGYSDESEDSIREFLKRTLPLLTGTTLEEARSLVEKSIPECPFACSPIVTAIDLFHYRSQLPPTSDIDFVVPASSENVAELKSTLEKVEKKGGGTVKVKLSGNSQTDSNCLKFLTTLSFPKTFIRFDANKAFTLEAAISFYGELEKTSYLPNVHYVEQPLSIKDWEGHKQLVEQFPRVSTMLDESIITSSDLQKAIAIGVPFVKFKLFKQGGIKELMALSRYAFEHKVKTVLGNGVATHLSNDIENSIFATHPQFFFGASEANGFLKMTA